MHFKSCNALRFCNKTLIESNMCFSTVKGAIYKILHNERRRDGTLAYVAK